MNSVFIPSPVVVVPLYRLPLEDDEAFSLSVLRKVLGEYPCYFISPKGLQIPDSFLKHERVARFSDRYFTYPFGYNRLLLESRLFRRFSGHSHILIYQLDCLVFRNELREWAAKNYDYIGSPWYENYKYDYQRVRKWWVGNGGFSLRKTSTALRVLNTRIKRGVEFPVPRPHMPQPRGVEWFAFNFQRRLKQHFGFWTVEDELVNYAENEDIFWALDVRRFTDDYTIPTPEEAMRFGFEQFPEKCLSQTNGQAPFGCHAWAKYDRDLCLKLLSSTAVSGNVHPIGLL